MPAGAANSSGQLVSLSVSGLVCIPSLLGLERAVATCLVGLWFHHIGKDGQRALHETVIHFSSGEGRTQGMPADEGQTPNPISNNSSLNTLKPVGGSIMYLVACLTTGP